MNIGAILVGFALLIITIPFVIDPFRPKAHQLFAKSRSDRPEKVDSSEKALFALRDLTFDFQTEKITEEDYERVRANLLAQAAEEIETRQAEGARIEAMIHTRRKKKATQYHCPECGKKLKAEDKFCSACGFARSISCNNCGRKNHMEGNFCTQCGNSLDNVAKNP